MTQFVAMVVGSSVSLALTIAAGHSGSELISWVSCSNTLPSSAMLLTRTAVMEAEVLSGMQPLA